MPCSISSRHAERDASCVAFMHPVVRTFSTSTAPPQWPSGWETAWREAGPGLDLRRGKLSAVVEVAYCVIVMAHHYTASYCIALSLWHIITPPRIALRYRYGTSLHRLVLHCVIVMAHHYTASYCIALSLWHIITPPRIALRYRYGTSLHRLVLHCVIVMAYHYTASYCIALSLWHIITPPRRHSG